jgi:hypothetical protein
LPPGLWDAQTTSRTPRRFSYDAAPVELVELLGGGSLGACI